MTVRMAVSPFVHFPVIRLMRWKFQPLLPGQTLAVVGQEDKADSNLVVDREGGELGWRSS